MNSLPAFALNRVLAAGAFAAWAVLAQAQTPEAPEPCSGFKWNLEAEHRLFLQGALDLASASEAGKAPKIALQQLYRIRLAPQDQVKFAAGPGKRMLTDGAHAGLVQVHVAQPGDYRISVDEPLWIDLVAPAGLIASKDFGGRPNCHAPHKVVVYAVPAAGDYLIQFSAGASDQVRALVTPAAAP